MSRNEWFLGVRVGEPIYDVLKRAHTKQESATMRRSLPEERKLSVYIRANHTTLAVEIEPHTSQAILYLFHRILSPMTGEQVSSKTLNNARAAAAQYLRWLNESGLIQWSQADGMYRLSSIGDDDPETWFAEAAAYRRHGDTENAERCIDWFESLCGLRTYSQESKNEGQQIREA